MASGLNAFICAIIATAYFTVIGFPFARRLHGLPAAALAPILGWALYAPVSLVILSLTGMSVTSTTLVAATALAGSGIAWWRTRLQYVESVSIPHAAFAIAGLVAVMVGAAVLPKVSGDIVAYSGPVFDHAKVAMVDEMVRAGVPATNPFFGPIGAFDRLPYYYLWHFTAAQFALLTGVSGWQADAAFTMLTAFSSLALMMGVATWLSGRAAAAYWVLAIAATASVRPTAEWLFGPLQTANVIRWATGFGGWLFQSGWAPQHVAGACCAVLSVAWIARLAQRPNVTDAAILGALVAAGYESSTWIGGIVVPLAAAGCGVMLLLHAPPAQRLRFVCWAAASAAIAALLALSMVRDQYVATAMRGAASVLTIEPYEVLGAAIPDKVRRALDLPAFWLVQLPVEFPAAFLAGVAGLAMWFRSRRTEDATRHMPTACLVVLLAVSLASAWLLVSTIGANNDLGWRAVLPGAIILIAFAAAWLAQPGRSRIVFVAAIVGIAAGTPHGIELFLDFLTAKPRPPAAMLAQTPALWDAVRARTTPLERVANNPLFVALATPWPINLSWALQSNRRSCYAGRELALPFVPVSAEKRDEVDALFVRVFAGKAREGDADALASRFSCDAAVVTMWDGAWTSDPFAASATFKLVEDTARWRIYRRTESLGDAAANIRSR